MEYKVYYKIDNTMEYQYAQTVTKELLDALILECFSDTSIELLIVAYDVEKNMDIPFFTGNVAGYWDLRALQESNIDEKQKVNTLPNWVEEGVK